MTEQRLEMRILRLQRRVARLERGLALMERWDESKYRPLRPFILEILDEDPDATDEEIVEALVEKVDQLLRFEGLAEIITDIGIRVAAEVGLWVYQNKKRLITQRIKRLQRRIAQLRKERTRQASRAPRAAAARQRAVVDDRAILLELGLSEAFLEGAKPTQRKPRARQAAPA